MVKAIGWLAECQVSISYPFYKAFIINHFSFNMIFLHDLGKPLHVLIWHKIFWFVFCMCEVSVQSSCGCFSLV